MGKQNVSDFIELGPPNLPERFRIIRELGRGGMAVVFHAHDTAGGRDVALKFITERDDDDAVRRFRREATDLAAVFHPNIVDFYSAGEVDGREFIEMEYVDGGTLRAFSRQCDSLEKILRVFVDICSGLEHIHSRGMVHRDIKPANILLTASGQSKISDLGLARRSSGRSEITEIGTVMGTAGYLAPEQIMSHSVGPGADLYALGICLYEAVTGHHPFPAENPLALIRAHLQDVAPLASETLPGLPKRLDQLIAKILIKDPLGRPTSATDIRDELERCIQELNEDQKALTPISARGVLERAKRHLDGERPEEALSLLRELEPDCDDLMLRAHILTQIARALYQQRAPEAIAYAQGAVEACRSCSSDQLGMALLLNGRAAIAGSFWEEASGRLKEAGEMLASTSLRSQIELMEAQAELHRLASAAGCANYSGKAAERYQELASGLRKREQSAESGTPYAVVFNQPVKPRRSWRLAIPWVAAAVFMVLFGVLTGISSSDRRTVHQVDLAAEPRADVFGTSSASARPSSSIGPKKVSHLKPSVDGITDNIANLKVDLKAGPARPPLPNLNVPNLDIPPSPSREVLKQRVVTPSALPAPTYKKATQRWSGHESPPETAFSLSPIESVSILTQTQAGQASTQQSKSSRPRATPSDPRGPQSHTASKNPNSRRNQMNQILLRSRQRAMRKSNSPR